MLVSAANPDPGDDMLLGKGKKGENGWRERERERWERDGRETGISPAPRKKKKKSGLGLRSDIQVTTTGSRTIFLCRTQVLSIS